MNHFKIHSYLRVMNIKSLIVFLSISFLTLVSYSQYYTKDNYSGLWQDTSSWINEQIPKKGIFDVSINCYGEISVLNCLDIKHSILKVYDTLLINGNLTLKNKSGLEISDGGIVFVFGNFHAKNVVDILNNGTLLVSGEFRIVGSANTGSFKNNGEVFIFDDTPEAPVGENYSDINCTEIENKSICGYGDEQDFKKNDLYSFFTSVPFSNKTTESSSGLCYKLDFYTDKNRICIYEDIIYHYTSIGVDKVSDVMWDFGLDANPSNAIGYGPHVVSYKSAGQKNVTVTDINNNNSISKSVFVLDQVNRLVISRLNSLNNIYETYLDEVCIGEYTKYTTDGVDTGVYHWVLPALNIDTITNNVLDVNWNTNAGEHLIFVREILDPDCSEDFSDGVVLVNQCNNEDILNQTTYAFTPNNDGVNETWVLPGIENYPLARIFVFNKYGEVLFCSESNYQNDWNGSVNGKILPIDSYFYIIDLSKYNLEKVRGIITIVK